MFSKKFRKHFFKFNIKHGFTLHHFCYKSGTGFTLLEVIIAIAVISIGLIGILYLVSFSISASSVAKNKLIAANLAQEGIELVRGIRDTNWVQGEDWDTGIEGTGNQRAGIIDYDDIDGLTSYFNPPPSDIDECGSNCRVYLKNDFYTHDSSGGSSTNFYRLILLDKISPTQIEVTCEIKWTERSKSYYLTVKDYLYEWQ
ncbi:prepilin-type N-terminal cleavage/methylation domain-containing protein [bacterium]|nr:prepilin-type N-terminal cleavage/methylation domain-containing protein [bacterium]